MQIKFVYNNRRPLPCFEDYIQICVEIYAQFNVSKIHLFTQTEDNIAENNDLHFELIQLMWLREMFLELK